MLSLLSKTSQRGAKAAPVQAGASPSWASSGGEPLMVLSKLDLASLLAILLRGRPAAQRRVARRVGCARKDAGEKAARYGRAPLAFSGR